jgi:hypothetical protein
MQQSQQGGLVWAGHGKKSESGLGRSWDSGGKAAAFNNHDCDVAGLLYGGATLALLVVRLQREKQAETRLRRQDWPALATLTLLGGIVRTGGHYHPPVLPQRISSWRYARARAMALVTHYEEALTCLGIAVHGRWR